MAANGDGRMDEASMALAILEPVAEFEGVDVMDLPLRLGDTVDLDALVSLFRGDSGLVTFEYAGYLVAVDHRHRVEVRPIGGAPPGRRTRVPVDEPW